MGIYEILLLLTAAAVFLLSMAAVNPRGAVWVSAVVLDLLLSDAYVATGYPYPEALMAACDFTVCAAIYYFGANRWEMWVWLVMQFSMLVSIVDLAANIVASGWADREVYLSVLEAANYAAFVLIGGVSGFVLAGRFRGAAFRPWRRLRLPVHPVLSQNAADRK